MAFDVLREAASCRAEGCELVFPGRWGGPRRSILGQFRKALDAAGLDPGITVHDLRHVAASATASQGVPLQVIGELLGHRTPAMTARYSHLLPSAVKTGVEEIGPDNAFAFSRLAAACRRGRDFVASPTLVLE